MKYKFVMLKLVELAHFNKTYTLLLFNRKTNKKNVDSQHNLISIEIYDWDDLTLYLWAEIIAWPILSEVTDLLFYVIKLYTWRYFVNCLSNGYKISVAEYN